jgi:hypothetical protein
LPRDRPLRPASETSALGNKFRCGAQLVWVRIAAIDDSLRKRVRSEENFGALGHCSQLLLHVLCEKLNELVVACPRFHASDFNAVGFCSVANSTHVLTNGVGRKVWGKNDTNNLFETLCCNICNSFFHEGSCML